MHTSEEKCIPKLCSLNNIYPETHINQSSLLARLISKQSRLDILYPRCCEQFAIEVNIDKLTPYPISPTSLATC